VREDRVIFPLGVACRDLLEEILFAVSEGFGRLALRQCQKRDTARLFLIAGKPEMALRILCNTIEAHVVFGEGKPGDDLRRPSPKCL